MLTNQIAGDSSDETLAEVVRAQSDTALALVFRSLTTANQATMLSVAVLKEATARAEPIKAEPAKPPRKPRSTKAATEALDAEVLARFSPGVMLTTKDLLIEVGAAAPRAVLRLVKAGKIERVGRSSWRLAAPAEER